MAKYKRRSQAEWQRIIQQQKISGLNVKVFCEQQGLSSKTLYKSIGSEQLVALLL